jgi:hypothetical protein
MRRRAVRIRRLVNAGRLKRLARRHWMVKSPLRRRTDRIEAWITATLLAIFLIGAPLSSAAAGHWVQHGGVLEQRAQQSWHQVPAVLVQGAPELANFDVRTTWSLQVPALARWAGPGGQQRVGKIPVPPGTPAGRTVEVWVDGSGRPTGAPLLRTELLKREISAAVLAPVVLAIVLFIVGLLVRLVMNRRRLAAWETGWASIGPRWTRHR